MTADFIDAEILRRTFVAIATSAYEDLALPALPVAEEVRTLAAWFCGDGLGDRRFTHRYRELADNPTKDQIRTVLEDPASSQKWRASDAAVVFITGHGMLADDTHWLVLRQSRTDALRATALKTVDIVGWLADTGIEHLLLVLDTCYAGKVAGDIVRFDQDLPKTWLVMASTAKNDEAVPGKLTGAVQEFLDELGGSTGQKYGLDRYLTVEEFHSAIEEKLGGSQRVVLVQGSQTSGPHVCLPNPKYQPPPFAPTAAPRRDLALLKTDMEAHWEPRARGVTQRTAAGWLFTGRAALMRRLIAVATGEPGVVLVTGGVGSGKSAVLARLVTLSDPAFRSEYADQIALIPAELQPPAEAVEVAVLATRKSATQIMTQICHATGALDAAAPTPSLEDARAAWQRWLTHSSKAITLVIDALDEASRPDEVLTEVLQHLEDPNPGGRRVRLIVGVRSTGGSGSGDPASSTRAGQQPLADRAQDLLRVDPAQGWIQVDEAPWWVREDIVNYVTSLLRVSLDSPYHDDETAMTKAVAKVLVDAAGTSFLFAKMAAEQLAARRQVVDVHDPAWRTSISQGVLGVFREDLHRSLPEPEERERAVDLLRAVAFAFGPGLPWRNIWPLVANAVADDPGRYGDRDIAWLLRTRLGGYLVADRADGVTVYRLFHDDLRAILYERWTELLAP
jgi:hypothetical protein